MLFVEVMMDTRIVVGNLQLSISFHVIFSPDRTIWEAPKSCMYLWMVGGYTLFRIQTILY